MLYKFKSKAGSDVIMMGANGDEVLRVIGKSPSPTGIIEPSAMAGAIAAIEKAIAAEEDQRKQQEAEAAAEGKTLPAREGVSLRQRAWPLVELMKRAQPAGHDIVWGV
ncbi:MAG: DUF1840 domain-containing protein [Rhizobacter sp.]